MARSETTRVLHISKEEQATSFIAAERLLLPARCAMLSLRFVS